MSDGEDSIFYAAEVGVRDHLCVNVQVHGTPAAHIDQLVADPSELSHFIATHYAGFRIFWDTAGVARPVEGFVRPSAATTTAPHANVKHLIGWCERLQKCVANGS